MKTNKKLRVLVLGSGGREHALCWKLAQSPLCESLYALPGNPGIEAMGCTLIPGSTQKFEEVKHAVLKHAIDLVVVGAEAPLCAGIVDYFQADPALRKVRIFGPTAASAQLEASKRFAKDFMLRHQIPTARYAAFTRDQETEAIHYLESLTPPYVIKADGLAAGKGVLIVSDKEQAQQAIHECFTGKFGEAGSTLVIEEFLHGIEFSVFAICDGKHYQLLPIAKDYKRALDGDNGLNTGGMGSVTPVPFLTPELREKVLTNVIKPTIDGMRAEGNPYTGFLFVGMMLTTDGKPYVIEYNVRMGDPETQVVMLAMNADLLELLYQATAGELQNGIVDSHPSTYLSVSLVSEGYPESYQTQKAISGETNLLPHTMVFHAGTSLDSNHELRTSGGRVFSVCGEGNNITSARKQAYAMADRIHFEGKRMRSDIGTDLLRYEP